MSKEQHNKAVKLINEATSIQRNRYRRSIKNNGNLSSHEIKKYLALSPDVRQLLATATEKLNLSARSYFKIIKVARTIADLDNSNEITTAHLGEALQYRQNT